MRQRIATIAGAALMLFFAYGPRAALPYLMPSWLTASGFDRDTFSIMLTVQALTWGVSAVFLGILADRGHARHIGLACGLLYALGLGLLPFAHDPWLAILLGGVATGIGLGGTTFAVVFAALARDGLRTAATGFTVVTAAAATAPLAFVPLAQAVLLEHGVTTALICLGLAMAFIALTALLLPGRNGPRPADGRIDKFLLALLFAGTAASGFQSGLVSAYLGVTLADLGLGVSVTVLSLLLLNLCNAGGALACGPLARRLAPGLLLAGLFGLRAMTFTAILLLPASAPLAFSFSALSGLAWLAALPLAALAAMRAAGSARHIGLMTGLLLAAWQTGSVAAVAFGYDTYGWWGNYHRGWQVSLGLGVVMAAAHFAAFRKTYQRR